MGYPLQHRFLRNLPDCSFPFCPHRKLFWELKKSGIVLVPFLINYAGKKSSYSSFPHQTQYCSAWVMPFCMMMFDFNRQAHCDSGGFLQSHAKYFEDNCSLVCVAVIRTAAQQLSQAFPVKTHLHQCNARTAIYRSDHCPILLCLLFRWKVLVIRRAGESREVKG